LASSGRNGKDDPRGEYSCPRRPIGSSSRLKLWQPNEIRDAGVDVDLREQRGHLPTMMCLMIEKVAEREPQRIAPAPRIHLADIGKLAIELCIRKPGNPGRNPFILRPPRGSERLEVRVELVGERLERVRDSLEAPHPNAVAEQNVIERSVYRLEECAP